VGGGGDKEMISRTDIVASAVGCCVGTITGGTFLNLLVGNPVEIEFFAGIITGIIAYSLSLTISNSIYKRRKK
jgi:hypothetical protein